MTEKEDEFEKEIRIMIQATKGKFSPERKLFNNGAKHGLTMAKKSYTQFKAQILAERDTQFLNILVKYETGEEDGRIRNLIENIVNDVEQLSRRRDAACSAEQSHPQPTVEGKEE